MISIFDIGGLYQSTPENLRDARTKAYMYACDKQIRKLLACAENAKVWCAIENVDEKYLDYLAAECRALLYDSSFPENAKRKLIANSQYWHAKLGISSTLEEVVNSAFPDKDTFVLEWFDYGGKPFRFKLLTDADMDQESRDEFFRMISEVKNARSILDGFDIYRKLLLELHSCGVCITESYADIGWEEQNGVI